MKNSRIIQREDIPLYLINEMIESLRAFTIGFYETRQTVNGYEPFLLGTGTLISYKLVRLADFSRSQKFASLDSVRPIQIPVCSQPLSDSSQFRHHGGITVS